MNTLLRGVACAVIVCALAACPETHVGPDFGLKPVALKPADWNGNWQVCGDDDVTHLRVTAAASGQITFTEVRDPKKKQEQPDKPGILTLRHASTDKEAKLYFATMREAGDKSELEPLLVHRADDDAFVFWMLNHAAVEKAIKAGQLKGSTKRVKDDPHNQLDSDPANYQLLVQPQFWEWQKPTVIQRLKQ